MSDRIIRSQQPLCLMFEEPENGRCKLVGVSDLRADAEGTYEVSRIRVNRMQEYAVTKETVLQGSFALEKDCVTVIDSMPVEDEEKEFYLIEWQVNGQAGRNHYFTNIIDIDYRSYLAALEYCGMAEFEGMEEV